MPEPAISVENLGKMYRIGVQRPKPASVRQALTYAAGAPFDYLIRTMRGLTEDETLWALREVAFEVKHGGMFRRLGRQAIVQPLSLLETVAVRADRAAKRLRITASHDHAGVSSPRRADRTICLAARTKGGYSQTFVREHVDRLPCNVLDLYSESFPFHRGLGSQLPVSSVRGTRLRQFFLRRLGRFDADKVAKDAFKRSLEDNGVQAILAEFGSTGVALMDVSAEMKLPLVVHFHGYDAYQTSMLEDVGRHYPVLFERAAAIVAVSRHMHQQLVDLGAPEDKLHYSPYGVDTDVFRGASPEMAPPAFISVGRFVDKKAPYLTLLAFRATLERVPDARLVMLGDGALLETCRQLAQVWEIADRVEFRGAQPQSAVVQALRTALAYVQHSIRTTSNDVEGTPVSVLEAGASGLPVVATRHTGIEDVVVHGETGFLVRERDVDTMAGHMVRLAEDRELARRLGQAGRARICELFSMERSIGALWDILQEAIESRSR